MPDFPISRGNQSSEGVLWVIGVVWALFGFGSLIAILLMLAFGCDCWR